LIVGDPGLKKRPELAPDLKEFGVLGTIDNKVLPWDAHRILWVLHTEKPMDNWILNRARWSPAADAYEPAAKGVGLYGGHLET
jgi:hypothetical protein